MAAEPVLRTDGNSITLPGGTAPDAPLLPGGTPAPMPEPAPDVVDPTPASPPLIPDAPRKPEPLERPPQPVGLGVEQTA
ncbi:MAG: hypothetical protein ACRD0N_04625 [Acidimicrobiales bacterium]